MMRSLASGGRSTLAASVLLVLLGVAPAIAASFTVFWDRTDFGFGPGYGVSPTTAANASAAGIPVVSLASLQPLPDSLPVSHTLDDSSLVLPPSGPATITSDWSGTNNTGITDQTLYIVYVRPVTDTIVLSGQQHTVAYDPADVGLTLNASDGWVLLQVPSDPVVPNSIPVYYPAVSLGTLANGGVADYQLFYTLKNPQVFQGTSNDELGMPKWSLAFSSNSAPIPEPSSGLLMFIGLVGIARARRKRS